MRILGLILAILMFQSCSNTGKKKSTPNFLQKTDEVSLFEVAKIKLEESLNEKVVYAKSTLDNGNWEIIFSEDTTHIAQNEIVKAYQELDRATLIVGDQQELFAIKSTWSMEMGNMFGIRWHIFKKSDGQWHPIKNHFGGGKFSDIEHIQAIKNGKIQTAIQKINQETLLQDENIEKKFYTIKQDSVILFE